MMISFNFLSFFVIIAVQNCPVEGTTFNCLNKPMGKYADPYDCHHFITCYKDNTFVTRCPPGLLYDGDTELCASPDVVHCENKEDLRVKCGTPPDPLQKITCFGKPDGHYPNPNDCCSFINCFSSEIDFFKCPKGFHYNFREEPRNGESCIDPKYAQCPIFNITLLNLV